MHDLVKEHREELHCHATTQGSQELCHKEDNSNEARGDQTTAGCSFGAQSQGISVALLQMYRLTCCAQRFPVIH